MGHAWAAAAVGLVLTGCGASQELPPPPGTDSIGVLAGQVGGGHPPDFAIPEGMPLVFTAADGEQRTITARDGWYEVELAPGVWNVRSQDGGVCVDGIRVHGGGSARHDLIWPAQCTSMP